ncbi:MAG: GerAB/ArcD/ProY family transporter [Ruminococcus flavefaciens]|nr:GerAB/ArcD/ProY family transporter [Ruminococcus flavefaciens]MCM1228880.1 GerAB/ArcD/ProY family transporter [Ruminococcus flavefaciens]
MNQINKAQFISLLLIEDLFVMFCLTESISVMTAVGFVIGIVAQFILSVPVIRLYSKGRTLKDCGKLAEIAILLYIVVWGGMLFSMLWNAGDIIYIPYENSGWWGKFIITAIIGVLCVYISASGIKALGRSALIASVLGVVCLLIVVISALIQSDIKNLAITDDKGFMSELNRGFALSGGIGSFILILGFTKGNPMGNAVGYFIGKIILTSAVILTGVLVSGGIMDITDFPIATAAQLSQPFPVQRIDSLFLIVFSVSAVYSIAVQASTADYLLDEVAPVKKYRSTIMLAVMALIGFLSGGKIHYGVVFSIFAVVVMLFAPVSYFIKRKMKNG